MPWAEWVRHARIHEKGTVPDSTAGTIAVPYFRLKEGETMATVSISGLPALSLLAGFVAAATVPVWMGAQVVGAERATIPRAAAALGLAVLGSFLAMFVVGSAVFVVAPIICVVVFKYLLDSSFLGAFILMVISASGLWLAGKLFGAGFSVAA
ncbi:hypothetical protein [Ralstonia solanacearum]|uniref:hypothetical protein n=1 Tax=Ralstonia solanacearum TaxID=305 RepID=UPI001E2C8234|nr:hypothetical protein [Ralstonia solanacearum]